MIILSLNILLDPKSFLLYNKNNSLISRVIGFKINSVELYNNMPFRRIACEIAPSANLRESFVTRYNRLAFTYWMTISRKRFIHSALCNLIESETLL